MNSTLTFELQQEVGLVGYTKLVAMDTDLESMPHGRIYKGLSLGTSTHQLIPFRVILDQGCISAIIMVKIDNHDDAFLK